MDERWFEKCKSRMNTLLLAKHHVIEQKVAAVSEQLSDEAIVKNIIHLNGEAETEVTDNKDESIVVNEYLFRDNSDDYLQNKLKKMDALNAEISDIYKLLQRVRNENNQLKMQILPLRKSASDQLQVPYHDMLDLINIDDENDDDSVKRQKNKLSRHLNSISFYRNIIGRLLTAKPLLLTPQIVEIMKQNNAKMFLEDLSEVPGEEEQIENTDTNNAT